MQLYIDKLRTPIKWIEPYNFTIVRTYDEAIKHLNSTNYNFISLDYELDNGRTADDIIKFIYNNNIPINFINLHSKNYIANGHLFKIIKKKMPDTVISFIKDL